MNNTEKSMEKLVALCKGRGFVYAGSEIYGGLANTWDYGPLGVELKNNIKNAWRKKFIQENPYNVGLDSAILMNPAILIFDEATSSLDTNTEQKIQEAMDLLVKNRTTIAIAHRFSTLKNADRLVVVENGKIVETGTHEQLFEKENGIYSKMAHMQLDALSFGKEEKN